MEQLCTLGPQRILYVYSHAKPLLPINLAEMMIGGEGAAASISELAPTSTSSTGGSEISRPAISLRVHPLVRRTLRRPFKTKQLIRLLLAMMTEPFPTTPSSSMLAPLPGDGNRSGDRQAEEDEGRSSSVDVISTSTSPPLALGVPAATAAAVASKLRQPTQGVARPPRITNIASKYPLRILLAEVSQHNNRSASPNREYSAEADSCLCVALFRHLQDNVMNQKLMVRVKQRQEQLWRRL